VCILARTYLSTAFLTPQHDLTGARPSPWQRFAADAPPT
jgi:hypothetical protein